MEGVWPGAEEDEEESDEVELEGSGMAVGGLLGLGGDLFPLKCASLTFFQKICGRVGLFRKCAGGMGCGCVRCSLLKRASLAFSQKI